MGKYKREFIWFLIEFPDNHKEWYCVSHVLREALFAERSVNQYWKNTMIGNYITVSISKYVNGRARLRVGKVTKIRILHHGSKDYHWTRNQFVTPDHLKNFSDAFNYLKHNYTWYNKLAIATSLYYWHNELLRSRNRQLKKKIRHFRYLLRKQIQK
ncbi:hypothetical protein [Lactobacillus sp. LL6]|uniref:DUF7679 family protein n=1 Tax=Lactobacillus sp. LL6 TaxID=2596827 RepID=UPI001186B738|nr:hypothetical protein [Lactobacillus sp. LL6]TSO25336.1 hypothetical protein FOD82_08860 [Lactobacillus sp. LL6]